MSKQFRIARVSLLALAALLAPDRLPAQKRFDVVVYGGTPAGIAAALEPGRAGMSTLLVEPYSHIGGMVANGLSHTDFRTFEALNGAFLEFTRRVQSHYSDRYGADSPQALGNFRGTHGEPHVNLAVFQAMLSEQAAIEIRTGTRLSGVDVEATPEGRRIARCTFTNREGQTEQVSGAIFIDATYEGDLMAAAGVQHRIGRESRDEYGESLAPESADQQVQGYNFRFVMTREPSNRVLPAAPQGYDRDQFLPLVPLLTEGRFPEGVFCDRSGGIYKAHLPPLPGGKHDVNDVSRGLVRLSLPDISDGWPGGEPETRRAIYLEHRRHNVGLLYFLQNDDSVPEEFRSEAREWGFCRDEFVAQQHIPEQLYIREGRRMVGRRIFTERDTDHAPGDARAVFQRDSIAIGDYGPNCHGTSHVGPRIGGRHEGEFYKRTPPYQIPYLTLLPADCTNLLVPVACSASHVGFCALRLEPIWTSLGQAAGAATRLALARRIDLEDVPVADLQRSLHDAGGATIYVSDVLPGDDDFAAVQWWGSLGGLHGLAPAPKEAGQRGENLLGQYYHAFPGHDAGLDLPLEPETRARWLRIAEQAGLNAKGLTSAATRGAFIRAAHQSLPPS